MDYTFLTRRLPAGQALDASTYSDRLAKNGGRA